MQQLILFLHILIAVAIVALVLLQQGKGANMGAAFGGGASNTLFGSRGPASFLMKFTGGLMALFFVTSLTLGYLSSQSVKSADQFVVPASSQAPVSVLPANMNSTVPNLTPPQAAPAKTAASVAPAAQTDGKPATRSQSAQK